MSLDSEELYLCRKKFQCEITGIKKKENEHPLRHYPHMPGTEVDTFISFFSFKPYLSDEEIEVQRLNDLPKYHIAVSEGTAPF